MMTQDVRFVYFKHAKTSMEFFFLFLLEETAPKLLDKRTRLILRDTCINSLSYSYPSVIIYSFANHKSNSSDMADNIESFNVDLSIVLKFKKFMDSKGNVF